MAPTVKKLAEMVPMPKHRQHRRHHPDHRRNVVTLNFSSPPPKSNSETFDHPFCCNRWLGEELSRSLSHHMHIYQIACCKSQLLLFGELVGNAFDSFCNFQHFEGMDFSWTLQIVSFCVLTILRGLLKTKVE